MSVYACVKGRADHGLAEGGGLKPSVSGERRREVARSVLLYDLHPCRSRRVGVSSHYNLLSRVYVFVEGARMLFLEVPDEKLAGSLQSVVGLRQRACLNVPDVQHLRPDLKF